MNLNGKIAHLEALLLRFLMLFLITVDIFTDVFMIMEKRE